MESIFNNETSFPAWLPPIDFFDCDLKLNGEDPFAEIFSPLQTGAKQMTIEESLSLETNTTAHEDMVLEMPSTPEVSSSQEENRSKDGLKLCRKISSLMLDMIVAPSDLFNRIMTFTSQVMMSLLHPLNLHGANATQIREIQDECLERLWTEFKDVMSYSKNKKICIVKQEHWNMIFDKKTSTTVFKQILATMAKSCKTAEGKLVLNDPVFCELFTQVLFYSNKLAVIVLILKDSSEKGKFLRELKTIDNFFMMMLLPDLLPFYNHRRGKFALECCHKCKICNSKQIPDDFLNILALSRKKTEEIASNVNQIFLRYGGNAFETGSCLVEFALTQL